ncbi:MAG: uracil-DNA glycosylase family protein [Bythopirellula sp.]|nr:uracil-DNA glycosylase family protein [Bythopirellula sp.]
MTAIKKTISAARQLASAVNSLRFAEPVAYVYNPLDYAWRAHQCYLEMMNPLVTEVLFLGMNPGPWGMAQTGVPFGHVPTVRDWLHIDARIDPPVRMHPKRPIEGLNCQRAEVSGERLWGLFRERFKSPQQFFEKHFVTNYCPLVFMEESGRNRTPDKLPAGERASLQAVCDAHLAAVLNAVKPRIAVGVGAYAEQCFQRVIGERPIEVIRILHPSPASPAANRGWAEAVTKQLVDAGVW